MSAGLRPDLTRTTVVLETLLPGVDPPDAPELTVPLWHVAFHMVPDLPESLVQGRQADYLRYFLDVGTSGDGVVTDDEIEHYAAAYGDAEHLRSAFEVYRAIPDNAAFFAAHVEPIDVPLLLVGGEHVFGPTLETVAPHLHDHYGWSDVRAAVEPGGRHYLPEEHPDEIAELVERHTADG